MTAAVLIVAAPDHAPADRVQEALERRGVAVVRLDPADYPARARLSVGLAGGRPALRLAAGGRVVELDRLRAVWLRAWRRRGAAAPAVSDPEARALADEECSRFLESAWDFLGDLCVPGSPSAMREAQLKAPQLRRAAALGLEVPRTVFTNDPEALLALYRERGGRIVSKTLAPLEARSRLGHELGRFTEPVRPRDVAYGHAISYCPIIIQEYVPKRLELRVTVVGGRVFAAEIHSQQTHRTRHDWRRYDVTSTPHGVHELPAEIAARCVALVKGSRLSFATIDLVLTPDGRYVFLELNSAGEYGWIEHLTGLPISEALAELLAAGPGQGARPGAEPLASASS